MKDSEQSARLKSELEQIHNCVRVKTHQLRDNASVLAQQIRGLHDGIVLGDALIRTEAIEEQLDRVFAPVRSHS